MAEGLINTAKWRQCSLLLQAPADELVLQACDEIDALRAELARYTRPLTSADAGAVKILADLEGFHLRGLEATAIDRIIREVRGK